MYFDNFLNCINGRKGRNQVVHRVNFIAANEKTITARETYSLFSLFSDVGGLVDFVRVFGNFVVSFFSAFKMTSMVANRLYTSRRKEIAETK